MGRVVATDGHKPLAAIGVTLIDAKGAAVDSTKTDSSGAYYLEAHKEGTYHLEFAQRGLWFDSSPEFPLKASDNPEAAFAIKDHASDSVLTVEQADVKSKPIHGNAAPRYPTELRSRSVQGAVLVKYVVDTRGQIVPGSVQTLAATSSAFAKAAESVMYRWRYEPALLRGAAVPQLVCYPMTFRLTTFTGSVQPDEKLDALIASWQPEGHCPAGVRP